MRWRRQLILLHRDIGYLCLGLTMVYAVSGIAVNHRGDWDYNYIEGKQEIQVGSPSELLSIDPQENDPVLVAADHQDRLVEGLVRELGRNEMPRRVFWRSGDRLSLFFALGDADTVDYLPKRGIVELFGRRDRPVFRQLNFLHLNEPHGVWTYVADAYAALLLFLAVSGAVVVKGRRGLRGRGGILALAGCAIPLVALWLWR